MARIGIVRNQYKLNPGLYCVGNPTTESPVFVTANYKLSLDALRKELYDIAAWILIADTRGINVWCAAGKGTFSADEIALMVKRTRLAECVSHRELILPQLAAPGVASYELYKKCGFKGLFGPIRAADIPRYLTNDKHVDEQMRTVTFTFRERLVLVPVEIFLSWKLFTLVTIAIFILSGFGPDLYAIPAAFKRGVTATGATLLSILAGGLVTPVFLPWIPGRQFWWKGLLTGSLIGLVYSMFLRADTPLLEALSLWIWIMATTSYMAMNFTGATPYTSLSGVKKEMQRALPLQCGAVCVALLLWIASPFIN
jgi:CO dehydrogenase/acetyl-CoA synthase delta subunit